MQQPGLKTSNEALSGGFSKKTRLLALGLVTLAFAAPVLAQTDSAVYDLTFVGTWSQRAHPQAFPRNAHFSGLVGATHSERVAFWSEGELASFGVQRMAEVGGKKALSAEVAAEIALGTASSLISGGGVGLSPGQVGVEISLSRDHPLVTAVSMIAPSPDWFVGVSGLSLLEDGEWADLLVVQLFAYDAGTDSGASFTSPNQATLPPEPITKILGAPFSEGVEVGHFIFRRTDGAALPTLSLRDGRFEASAVWESAKGDRGIGQPTQITDDTGYFWFFQASNTEVLVKVLLGCFLNSNYWVFAGGLTNLEVHLLIEDTESEELHGYKNRLGDPFVPIQDTAAFATCP